MGIRFASWLDRFFASYFRRRPVDATFIGQHDHDGSLPDRSEASVDEILGEMRSLQSSLGPLHRAEPLSPVESLDARLAQGFLEIESWELESGWFHRFNPCWYTGEAIFGMFSLLLRDFAPLPERLEHLGARMAAVPKLLDQCRQNVKAAPAAWTERALRECDGALAFFDSGLLAVPGADRVRHAAAGARSSFLGLRRHLEIDLLRHPAEDPACGEEAFRLLLRKGHFLDRPAAEIAGEARETLRESKAALASKAPGGDWLRALSALEEARPTRETYYRRYGELWEEARDFAVEKGLVTWPDFPVEYVARPLWARRAAPHLYFLFYRSPAPMDPPSRTEYLITPLEAELPEEEAERLLRETNDSVIKLNHVVHHGGLGHHLQNWHAMRAPSRIGRIAAVDCASRIAMFCGGTMAEGWASYATELMDEAGFLTPLESSGELASRARRAARAVVDVELHHGKMGFEDACRFHRQELGLGPAAARNEVTKSSMFPGTGLCYFVGSRLIRELRQEQRRLLGERFDLKSFHDRLLSLGSIPLSRCREFPVS